MATILVKGRNVLTKDSVDMYGGFVGTESKTWERIMDEDGYPVQSYLFCGDIKKPLLTLLKLLETHVQIYQNPMPRIMYLWRRVG